MAQMLNIIAAVGTKWTMVKLVPTFGPMDHTDTLIHLYLTSGNIFRNQYATLVDFT